MCSSLKEYCLLARTYSEELLPLAGLDLGGDLVFVTRVPLFSIGFSSLGLLSFSLALTLLTLKKDKILTGPNNV